MTKESFRSRAVRTIYGLSCPVHNAEPLRGMSKHLIPVVIIDEDLADFSGPTLSARLKSRAGEVWQGAMCSTIAVRGDATLRGKTLTT